LLIRGLLQEVEWFQVARFECHDVGGSRLADIDFLIELVLQDESRCYGDNLGKLVFALAFSNREPHVHLCSLARMEQDSLKGATNGIETLWFAPLRIANFNVRAILLVVCRIREHVRERFPGTAIRAHTHSLTSSRLC